MEPDVKTLGDVIAIVKRRKNWLIWPAVGVFLLSAIIAFAWPPTYRSTSTILIEEQEIPREYVMTTVSSYAEQRLQTINQRIMSSTRLMEIINRFKLYEDLKQKWTTEEIIDKMRKKDVKFELINAEVIDRRTGRPTAATIAFQLSFEGRNPAVVQQVANVLASLYLEENLRVREQQTEGATKFMEEESKAVEEEMAEVDRKIAAYKQQLKSSPQEPIFDLNIEEGTRADIEVNMIQQELAQVKSEIAVLEEKYTTEAPPLKALRNTQASLQGRLDRALAEARGRLLESAEARTRQELAVAEKALLEAETQIEQCQRRIEAQTELAVKAAGQQAGIEALQAEEADLADKIKHIESIIYSIDVESKAPGRISLTSNLFPPARADYGRRKQLMALAFLASACAAVAAGLWRELTDKQVRSAQDVAVLTGLPVLATVPHASLEQSNARHDGSLLQTAREPGSTSADQFRRILTRIIYPPEGSAELNTCLVVSPGRGDGKTSLACNLPKLLLGRFDFGKGG